MMSNPSDQGRQPDGFAETHPPIERFVRGAGRVPRKDQFPQFLGQVISTKTVQPAGLRLDKPSQGLGLTQRHPNQPILLLSLIHI